MRRYYFWAWKSYFFFNSFHKFRDTRNDEQQAVPDQSEITTKWTVQFFIGFGYPAGEMEVTIKSDFGVKPIRNFDIRSFGKGFNRLLRVCNGLKELFIDSLK